jgi:exonuclease III
MSKKFLFLLTIFNLFSFIFGLKSGSDTQCPLSPSIPLDRRTNKQSLRLVQYNVEWMFIDTYSNCPGTSCTWANQSEALAHMGYISSIINELNPDIINFCEIEGCDELNMLIEKTNLEFKPYLKQGTDSATGQNVGMLSLIDPIEDLVRTENKKSYPIENSSCGYNSSGSTGVSKHYMTKFDFSGIPVVMISVHLLAIPTDPYRCSAREAQALILQEQIFNYVSSGYEVIMLGDFNDYDNLILDSNSNKPNSQVLDILKGNKGTYSNKYQLKSIGEKMTQTQRYSEYWDANSDCVVQSNEFSMIDHILLTPLLFSKATNAFAYHVYPHSCDGTTYNSDHDPVVVDFNFN